MAGRKIPNLECLFVHREKGLFLSVYVDDIKLAGKIQNIDPLWKVLMKEVTQRECKTSNDILDSYQKMFESRISARDVEKQPVSQKSDANISSWSYDMEVYAKRCVQRHCELANKTTQPFFRVATPCLDDHQFKEEEMGSVGELSKMCSKIVLKCLFLYW